MVWRAKHNFRPGAALLVVLFIVMAVTLISLGFIARSDKELACASNVETRMQMDYMAETGLVHAKNFIINPQSVDVCSDGYWAGGTGLYIENNGDYYDITVERDTSSLYEHCNYTITSESYRLDSDGDRISQSSMAAELKLDPCIGYWVGSTYMSETQVTVYGDIYCRGSLRGYADINGDAYAASTITASYIEGDSNSSTSAPISFPNVDEDDLIPTYTIGSKTYSAEPLSMYQLNTYHGPSMNNPAGIYYTNGDLVLQGNVSIYGVLVVGNDLYISGGDNYILSHKEPYSSIDTNHYPALVVDGYVYFYSYGQLYLEGLAQINNEIEVINNCSSSFFHVWGGLFIKNGNIDIYGGSSTDIEIEIIAAPEYTALEYLTDSGNYKRWVSAAGGFFKTISR